MRVGDIETDGLLDEMTKMHCYVDKAYKKDEITICCNFDLLSRAFVKRVEEEHNITWIKHEELTDHLESLDALVIHNLFGFDLEALKKLGYIDSYDMYPEHINGKKTRLIDSLSMSRCLYPDRPMPRGCPSKVKNPVTGKMDTIGSHGLAAWGYRVSNAKPEVHDWRDQPLEVYVHRCLEDVIINELVLIELIKESNDIASSPKELPLGLVGEWKGALRLNNKSDFLMNKQEKDGILLDREGAEKLRDYTDVTMDEIAEDVEKSLPMRELPESSRASFPSEPFKQNGEISSYGWNWIERLGYNVDRGILDFVPPSSTALKKDGTISTHGKKYCEKRGVINEDEMVAFIESSKELSKLTPLSKNEMEFAKQDLRNKKEPSWLVPMEISNQKDIKSYLTLEQGWQPTIWNTKDATRDNFKRPYEEHEVLENIKKYVEDIKGSIYEKLIYQEMEINPDRLSYDMLLDKLKRKARYLVTSPKFKDERGELCPSLELLEGVMAKKIVKWLSLRNRRSVIQTKDEKKTTGWLNNPRLKTDGRIGQGNSGVTNTNRYKHRTIVNLPKASPDVLLGKEMRGLFISPEDYYILGYDGSNLEQFVAGSYAWVFDDGDYLNFLGTDSHTVMAERYTIACGRTISRSVGKNITYAVLYGAQAAKIGKMLGISKNQGQGIIDAFWDTNYGLKKLKDHLEKYWESTKKKYIRGIDGRKIYTRSKHSLVNCLFQSCGSILMFISGCFMYDSLKKEGYVDEDAMRLAFVHDEYQYQVHKKHVEKFVFDTEEEALSFEYEDKLLSNCKEIGGKFVRYYSRIGELGNLSLKKAGEYLKMPVPFRADYDIGFNLAETH